MSSVTVIIPTLNEEKCLPACLKSIGKAEIIVVDGGSSDRTCEIAKAHGAKVVHSPKGIAKQCNRGAAEATGEILLFLAADSELPKDWKKAIADATAASDVAGGGFSLAIDHRNSFYFLLSKSSNVRAQLLRFALVDQGLFIYREIFEEIDGMKETLIPFVTLSWDLQKHGRFELLSAITKTSARKWEEGGRFRTTFSHLKTSFRFILATKRARP